MVVPLAGVGGDADRVRVALVTRERLDGVPRHREAHHRDTTLQRGRKGVPDLPAHRPDLVVRAQGEPGDRGHRRCLGGQLAVGRPGVQHEHGVPGQHREDGRHDHRPPQPGDVEDVQGAVPQTGQGRGCARRRAGVDVAHVAALLAQHRREGLVGREDTAHLTVLLGPLEHPGSGSRGGRRARHQSSLELVSTPTRWPPAVMRARGTMTTTRIWVPRRSPRATSTTPATSTSSDASTATKARKMGR